MENKRLYVAGIDPGLASGGLVVLSPKEENRVIASYSLVPKPQVKKDMEALTKELAEERNNWGDKEFTAAILRAERWIENLEAALEDFDENYGQEGIIQWVGIESFVDQRSRAREEKQRLVRNRWHTPLVMGMIVAVLRQRNLTVENKRLVYQNAGIVIRQLATEIGLLKNRKNKEDIVVLGDYQIKNDHERKAFAHALALSLRIN